MQVKELKSLINKIANMKCETNTIEIKSANKGCPKRLYDTLSSFSNQDSGGTIIFGIDEENDFKKVGVYDIQDLQKQVTSQCKEMEPTVRPLFTVTEDNQLYFLSAEIPAVDITSRPCYYKGKGRTKGSYIRVGDSDEPMTDYEIYSYEAYRKRYKDDIRPIEQASFKILDMELLNKYINICKKNKPNLSKIVDVDLNELLNITCNGKLTLSTIMLFSPYPQSCFPQLSVVAVSVPGEEIGVLGDSGERFLDNARIEGNISDMLEKSINFISKNIKIKTIIDPVTGKRADKPEYPITAIRECILNALVHRDYSIHSEGQPIQINIFSNRLEITSPGGLYGRIAINQLGKIQADTRNPVLATAMETLGLTENRYSGIPTIRNEMKKAGLPEPVFESNRGFFRVTLYNTQISKRNIDDNSLIEFCTIPRSRKEIAEYLGISSISYAIKKYINPLLKSGDIALAFPTRPQSPKQKYISVVK